MVFTMSLIDGPQGGWNPVRSPLSDHQGIWPMLTRTFSAHHVTICRWVALCLLPALSLAGCASQLYQWNMEHAYIAPAARLPRLELEQVMRTVTQKSLNTVIGITRWTEHGRPDEIIVYTELDPSASLMMVYNLRKQTDGLWHIVDYGEGTIIVW